MKETLYVMLMKAKNPLNLAVIHEHVEHLRRLDDAGKLVICGPFEDFPGGMVVFRAGSLDDARAVAESDPFVAQGFREFEIRTLDLANRENGYGTK